MPFDTCDADVSAVKFVCYRWACCACTIHELSNLGKHLYSGFTHPKSITLYIFGWGILQIFISGKKL